MALDSAIVPVGHQAKVAAESEANESISANAPSSTYSPYFLPLGGTHLEDDDARYAEEAAPVAAGATQGFERISLAHGISVEVPSNWVILPGTVGDGLRAGADRTLEAVGIGRLPEKQTLLAMNAPTPAGAMIRVSASSLEETQESLAAMSPTRLAEMAGALKKPFTVLQAAGGPQVVDFGPVEVVRVGGRRALLVLYTRTSLVDGRSHWRVAQFRIPTEELTIEFTLSYRVSEVEAMGP